MITYDTIAIESKLKIFLYIILLPTESFRVRIVHKIYAFYYFI